MLEFNFVYGHMHVYVLTAISLMPSKSSGALAGLMIPGQSNS